MTRRTETGRLASQRSAEIRYEDRHRAERNEARRVAAARRRARLWRLASAPLPGWVERLREEGDLVIRRTDAGRGGRDGRFVRLLRGDRLINAAGKESRAPAMIRDVLGSERG